MLLLAALAGCGSSGGLGCTPALPSYTVTPSSATADHASSPPGNQRQFIATSAPGTGPGCATSQVVERLTPAWTVSDSLHVSISSAQDATNGLAICLGPTRGPATITAHVVAGTAVTLLTATLFCE